MVDTVKWLALLACALALSACADTTATPLPDASDSPEVLSVQSQAAQQEAARLKALAQQRAAQQTISARAVETASARQTQVAAVATRQAEANATATVSAFLFSVTQTAIAQSQAAQLAQAQATASAEVLNAQLERERRLAEIAQVRAASERIASDEAFYQLTNRWLFVVGSLLAMCLGALVAYLLAQVCLMKFSLTETSGGLVIFRLGGFNQVEPTFLLPRERIIEGVMTRHNDSSVRQSLVSMGKADLPGGQHVALLVSHDRDTALALRLLREAMNLSGRSAKIVPTADALGWSSETRTRAVALLKPHLFTLTGRTGGTFLSPDFDNLHALYMAVGNRQAPLSRSIVTAQTIQSVAQIESN